MTVTLGGWCASWPSGQSALSESLSPTGKPVAMKVARPVWGGGKAEKPYLSLLTSGITTRLLMSHGVPKTERFRTAGTQTPIASTVPTVIVSSGRQSSDNIASASSWFSRMASSMHVVHVDGSRKRPQKPVAACGF